jgi:hypothetical protein
MASDRESKIPPTGDLIRGVPAPAGTWPDHETSSGREVNPNMNADFMARTVIHPELVFGAEQAVRCR